MSVHVAVTSLGIVLHEHNYEDKGEDHANCDEEDACDDPWCGFATFYDNFLSLQKYLEILETPLVLLLWQLL